MSPTPIPADDTDREDETVDVVPYAGEPDFTSTMHWEGIQDEEADA